MDALGLFFNDTQRLNIILAVILGCSDGTHLSSTGLIGTAYSGDIAALAIPGTEQTTDLVMTSSQPITPLTSFLAP